MSEDQPTRNTRHNAQRVNSLPILCNKASEFPGQWLTTRTPSRFLCNFLNSTSMSIVNFWTSETCLIVLVSHTFLVPNPKCVEPWSPKHYRCDFCRIPFRLVSAYLQILSLSVSYLHQQSKFEIHRENSQQQWINGCITMYLVFD